MVPSTDLIQVKNHEIEPFIEDESAIINSSRNLKPSVSMPLMIKQGKATSPKRLDLSWKDGDEDIIAKWYIDQKIWF